VNLTGFSAIHTAVLTGRGPQFLAAGLFSHVLLQSVGPNVLSRLSSAFNKQNTATAVGIRVSYDTQLDRDIAAMPRPQLQLCIYFSNRWAVVGYGRVSLLSVRLNYQSWFASGDGIRSIRLRNPRVVSITPSLSGELNSQAWMLPSFVDGNHVLSYK
jgi:hypothetical protein